MLSLIKLFKPHREKTRQDKIILLSDLRPITTGVSIQTNRILIDPVTDLNSIFYRLKLKNEGGQFLYGGRIRAS